MKKTLLAISKGIKSNSAALIIGAAAERRAIPGFKQCVKLYSYTTEPIE